MQEKEFGLKPSCLSILMAGPFTAFPWIIGLTAITFFLFFFIIDLNPGISIIGLMLTKGFDGAMIISVASKSAFAASLVILAEVIPAYLSLIIFGEHLFFQFLRGFASDWSESGCARMQYS